MAANAMELLESIPDIEDDVVAALLETSQPLSVDLTAKPVPQKN
jgi:hypothetical protein